MMTTVTFHPSLLANDTDDNRVPMNQGLCWRELPGEILMLLSARLPRESKSSARLACKAWSSWVARGCSQLRVRGSGPPEWGLRFSELEEMTWSVMTDEHDAAAQRLSNLATLTRLRALHLRLLRSHRSVTTNPQQGTTCCSSETFKPLGQLSRLTGLHIEAYTSCGNVGASWLESLRPVRQKLKSLKLRIRDDPETAMQLVHFAALTDLNLSGSNGITRVGVESIAQLTALEHLNLSSCITRIPSDVPFEDLSQLKSLQTLDLSFNYGIPDARVVELRHLSTLCVLRLAGCIQLTDLPGLRNLKSLTTLDLSGCRQVTNAGVAELKALKALTSLNLSRCYNITDAGMAKLKHLPALRIISLRECWKITDSGLQELGHLTQLTNLDLSECTGCITAAGVAMLTKHLVGLEALNLDHVNITNEELEQLQALVPSARLSREMWMDALGDVMNPDGDGESFILAG